MQCSNLSFSELINLYRRERIPSPEMVSQVELVVASLGNVAISGIVQELSRTEILKWRDWLLEDRQVSRITWNNYRAHLRALLNFAVEHPTVDLWVSPLEGVKQLPTYKQGKKLIPSGEVSQLIAILGSPVGENFRPQWFWKKVIRMLYYTGMRRKQLAGLCWKDIHWNEGEITLRATSSKTRREWNIPLPFECREDLELLRTKTGQKLGRSVYGHEQIFNVTHFYPRYTGDELTGVQLTGFFRRLKDKTGIEVCSKRFRHSYGTQAAKTGEIKQVQAQMGHTNVKTTYEYVQADMDGMRRVGAAIQTV